MEQVALTLYELNRRVRDVIESSLTEDYWVQAELSDIRERGHCYMELVQNDAWGHTPVAKARANCWANRWPALRRKFEQATGSPMRQGMQLLLRVVPTFHEAFGFSYQVTDVDPSYTLGDMARRRQEIVRLLREEGVFDLQRELQLPLFAQRVAVISSASAAGYGDFCRQLAENVYGFAFSVELFEAAMQGEQVESSVIAALNRINRHIDEYDVVVIIRGGGATADMSGFDTLLLAENVANFPLPVITGIGHDRDECVLDMVAHTRVKTPTAAAAWLVDHLAEVYDRIEEAQDRLRAVVERRIERERMRVDRVAERIPTLFALYKTRQEARMDALYGRLSAAIARRLERERHRLDLAERTAASLDPQRLLRRGYSITLLHGHSVRDPKLLQEGDEIETRMEKGTVKSVIIK